ncbi:MAG: hypothetical protein KGN79_04490 [Acidobacteriota bacterium]|nr:hypothetical protein [Acidobacteriota bacterium]
MSRQQTRAGDLRAQVNPGKTQSIAETYGKQKDNQKKRHPNQEKPDWQKSLRGHGHQQVESKTLN